MNDRQDYLLFKARIEYEQAKDKHNNHCEKLTEAKSSKRVWGEELDVLSGKLAVEAVEYIGVLQEAYERRGYELEELKQKGVNQTNTKQDSEESCEPTTKTKPIYGSR
jgi:hypothetical protein